MANTIQIKRKTNAGAPSSLADGELALNTTDDKLYIGNSGVSEIDYLNKAGGTLTGHLKIENGIKLARTSQYENLISCEDSGGNQTLKILGNRAASNGSSGTDVRIGGEQNRTTGNAFEVVQGSSTYFQIASSGAATFFGNSITASGTGHLFGKLNVGSVNNSFDFYNNGTSYFNGAVTVDDNLTVGGSVYINDTNTRIFEGGGNSVRLETNSGYIDVGPQNSGWAHFQTDRSRFYFNNEIVVDSGIIRSYNEDLQLDAAISGGAKNIRLLTAGTEKIRMDTDGALLINTTSKGTNTGKFFIGSPLTTGSSAIAQMNGFVRASYFVTHATGTGASAHSGLQPHTNNTGNVGNTDKRYYGAYFNVGSFSNSLLVNDSSNGGFGKIVNRQAAHTNADGIATVNTVAQGSNSLRLWVDSSGNRKINAGGTEVFSFTTSAITLTQPTTFSGHVTLAGDATGILYFGSKRALEGQISNNNLDIGEHFANIRMRSSTAVYPTNSITLGTSANRWSTIYGAAGDFSGSVSVGGALDCIKSGTNIFTIQGSSSGYVNAGISLRATSDTHYRGLGVFMHDAGGDTEWFAGRPYADSDKYIIARKASQASHSTATAQNANALFTIYNSGNVAIKGIPYPTANNTYTLGTSANRWSTIYGGAGDFSGNVTVGGYARSENITYAANQDVAYLIAGTSGWTGATTNWNTYGFQHRIKTNSGGVPRVTIDRAGGEAFSVDNSSNVAVGNELSVGGQHTRWTYSGQPRLRSDNEFFFLRNSDGGAQAARFKGIQVSDTYNNAPPTNGIRFGTDTQLYRSAANTLSLGSDDSLKLGDSSKIKLGDSDDLQLYHDGSNSYIKEASTGDIILDTNSNIRFKSSTEHLLSAAANGAVELYYDNAKKFETLSNGAKVTQYLFGSDGEILAGQDSSGYYFATGAGQNISKPVFIGDNASYIKMKAGDAEKLRVTTTGATVTGNLTASGNFSLNNGSAVDSDMPLVVGSASSPFQTVAQFGSSSSGIFIIHDSAHISSGVYYNGAWIGTSTSSTLLNFSGGQFQFQIGSGTVGGTHTRNTKFTINSTGATVTGTLQVTPAASEQGITIGDASKGEVPLIFKGVSGSHSIGQNGSSFFISKNNSGNLDNNPRFVLDTNGNCGLGGVTAPSAKLQVAGSAIFSGATNWAGNDTQTCAIYLNNSARGLSGNFANYARNLVKANSQYVEVGQNSTLVYGVKFIVGSNAANGFMFQSNIGGTMTTHMNIRGNTGHVGIGTAAPEGIVHIEGGSSAPALIVNSTTSSNSARIRIGTGSVGAATDNGAQLVYEGTSTNKFSIRNDGAPNSSIGIFTRQSGGAHVEAIHIDSSQRVGIGGTPSAAKLHVVGDAFIDNTGASGGLTVEASSDAKVTLQAAQNTAYSAILSAHWNYTTPMTLRGYGGIVLAQNTGVTKTLLYANNAEQIRITSTGVGIGLGGSDPSYELEVQGSISNYGDGKIIRLRSNDYIIGQIENRGTGADYDKGYFRLFDAGTAKVVIDSAGHSYFKGGSVGINKTPAGYGETKLEVNGNVSGTRFLSGGAITNGSYAFEAYAGTFEKSSMKLMKAGSGENEDSGVVLSKQNAASTGDHVGGIYFQGNSSLNYAIIRGTCAGSSKGQLNIHIAGQQNTITRTSNDTPVFQLGEGGLALGATPNDAYKLYVNGASYFDGKVSIGGTTSNNRKLFATGSLASAYLAEFTNTHSTQGYGVLIKAGDDNNVTALSVNDKDGNEKLRVRSGGQITFANAYTFPTSIGSAGQVLKVPSSGTTLEWGSGGGGSGTVNENHAAGTEHEVAVHLGSSTVGEAHKMIYNSGSGLTINTTSSETDSTYALYVAGGIKNSTGGLYVTGDGYISSRLGVATSVDTSYGIKVAGYIASYGHTTWSDYRLKDNATLWNTSEAATLVKDVPVYSYRWNDNCEAKSVQDQDRIGFLAHEVSERINKNNLVINEKDGEKYQSVNQTDMIPILWAALQDALKRIEELEAK